MVEDGRNKWMTGIAPALSHLLSALKMEATSFYTTMLRTYKAHVRHILDCRNIILVGNHTRHVGQNSWTNERRGTICTQDENWFLLLNKATYFVYRNTFARLGHIHNHHYWTFIRSLALPTFITTGLLERQSQSLFERRCEGWQEHTTNKWLSFPWALPSHGATTPVRHNTIQQTVMRDGWRQPPYAFSPSQRTYVFLCV